ncbi:cytochrome c1 [Lentibacter algarum]|uniref:cytochrome c1 n=1 Tax=Lentibacter algarum TaxID=576131 RepID=UPI001C07B87E|nr:cytochrome c1 [Lentibacter algarum]MBU2980581.1 cytochrome c1 [Lentibacter algarum]
MLKKLALSAVTALALSAGGVHAAGGEGGHIENIDFSFDGMFGAYDQFQLQRGLKVYTEVCSACHGMTYVPLRTLGDEGGPHFSAAEVRAYAAENFTVYDPETDEDVPAKPVDHFPASNDENAPDLSLMAKKRAGFHGPSGSGINQLLKGMGGPEYIVAILTGYHEAPDCAPEDFDGYYNVAFAPGGYPEECVDDHGHRTVPGSWIGMAPPLDDGLVEFDDGHDNSLHHMSEDAAAFLMWAAEPKMMARKRTGLIGVIMLSILACLLYLTNKRLWAPHKPKKH